MKGFARFLWTTLVGGLLFLVPLIVLGVVVEKALVIAYRLVGPLAAVLPFPSLVGLKTPVFLAAAVVVLLCFLAGVVARGARARKAVERLEEAVLSKLPGYALLKGMSESMLGVEREGHHPVVLARFDDAWQLGLEISRLHNGLVTVYLPGAPNPHSGTVAFMAADRIVPAGIPLAAMLKCQNRIGADANALLRDVLLEPPVIERSVAETT